MRIYVGQVAAIVRKDILLELRTWERLTAMAGLAVLVAVLFHFSVDTGLIRVQDMAAGLVWITILFGGMVGMGRTFKMEEERGAMQGLLLSPVPLDGLYLAKVTSNFILLSLVEIVAFAAFWLFFNLDYGGRPALLAAVVTVSTVGFVSIVTLFSAMSARTRMGETLLPILVFPMIVPVVIFGVSATARVFAGRPAPEIVGNLGFLGAFAVLALSAGFVLFRYVVEE